MADADVINSISIQISADTSKATSSINNLTKKMERLQSVIGKGFEMPSLDRFTRALDKLSGIGKISIPKSISERIADIGNATRSLEGVDFSKLQQLAAALERLSAIKAIKIPTISGSGAKGTVAEKIMPAGDALTGTDKVEGGTKAVEDVGKASENAEPKVESFASSFSQISAKVGAVASKIWSKFVPALKATVSWLGKTAFSIATLPMRKMASAIGGAVKRLGNFLSALKRIALYRAIRSIIKDITAGFKEGLGNLYQYSLMVEGQFAKSMDMLATSALYAKNSLGAMAAPIVNQLAPAVDILVDKFVDLLNIINETIASLTGADTWTKAIKYPTSYAEAADDATKSAKELRATLLGFDEINRLDDNSSGSRGSGSDALDYSKMFEEMDVDKNTAGWIDKIKEAWRNADFTEIGTWIGTGLKNGLDSIPWTEIKSKASHVAKSIATLINGFVEVDDLGTSIGSSIAEAFNVGLTNINTFFNTVHWDSIGDFIGDGVMGFVDTFDVELLGENLATVINSGVTMLNRFIKRVNWLKVGEFITSGINSFFNTVNTKELGETISNGIIAAIMLVHTFFKETDFKLIGERIGELVKGLDWTAILGGLAAILFNAILAVIKTVAGMIRSNLALGLLVAGAIALRITAALTGTTVTTIISNGLSTGISAAANLASGALGGVGSVIGTTLGVAAAAALGFYIGYKLQEIFPEVAEWADSVVETVAGTASELSLNPFKNVKTLKNEIFGYASGGTPETGSLFLANESGPELVANVGRKTQVANNDQIMSSIQTGVEVANEEQNAILREQNDLLRRLLAKDTNITTVVSTDSIISGLERKNRRDGKTIVPVGV